MEGDCHLIYNFLPELNDLLVSDLLYHFSLPILSNINGVVLTGSPT